MSANTEVTTRSKLNRFVIIMGCHRRPDRSFFFRGHQFPVCARCTGVFLGEVGGIVGFFFWRPDVCLCLTCCVVMLADWLIQEIGIRESTNIRRLITGILGGYGTTGITMWILYLIVVAIRNLILS